MKILCREVHSHVPQSTASSHGAARHQLPTVRLCPAGPPRQDGSVNALRWTELLGGKMVCKAFLYVAGRMGSSSYHIYRLG